MAPQTPFLDQPMKPPSLDDLPPVARLGPEPMPGREALYPREPFINAFSMAAGLVMSSSALFIGVASESGGDFLAALIGGAVSWLMLATLVRARSEEFRHPLAERAAAMAIPREALDRVIMRDLGQGSGAPRRWASNYAAHLAAGRIYEAMFWLRVTDRAHRILIGRSFWP